MRISIAILLIQLALTSISHAQINAPSQFIKRDHHLAKRGDGTFSGRATFYSTGLGACGDNNTDTDFIVALNAPQYTANKWCGKKIKITFGKKSTYALIKDECPGCPYGGLDMSPSLFEFFASKDVGVFYMNWSLDDGGSDDSPPPAAAPPPPPPSPPAKQTPPPASKPSTPQKSDDSPTPSKQTNPPPPYDSDDLSDLLNHAQQPTVTPKPSSGNTTSANDKSRPTSTTTQVNSVNPPSVHQGVSLKSSQSISAYAPGGNLDTITQLVISFGSLAVASADNVLNKQS